MVHGLLLCTIIYFGLFLHLDSLSIRDWDESRNALNAIDMSWTHNYLVRSCFGAPDMWETKPPLLTWLQCLSIKVFGYNELAIRLPTALAAAAMLLIIAIYLKHKFKTTFISYFYVLMMLSTFGFVYWHNARTGDHEALYVLFGTIMVITFYEYLLQNKLKYLVATFTCFILGYYAKSTAIFLYLPGMFIAVFVFGNWKKVFGDYKFWIGGVLSILIIIAYYFLREEYNPGYIKNVIEGNTAILPKNSDNIWVTLKQFWLLMSNGQFVWISLLPISIVVILFIKSGQFKLGYYLLLISVLIYPIISFCLYRPWYDSPLFPILSIVIAYAANLVFTILLPYVRRKSFFPVVIIFVIFFFPFYDTIDKNLNAEQYDVQERLHYGYHLNLLKKEHSPYKRICILQATNGDAHIDFYRIIFNKYYGYKITWKDMIEYRDCDTVMTSDKDIKWILNTKFNAKSVSGCKNSEIFILQPQK